MRLKAPCKPSLYVAVVAHGHPLDSQTWSGTARNLAEAFASESVGIYPVDATNGVPLVGLRAGVFAANYLLRRARSGSAPALPDGVLAEPWRVGSLRQMVGRRVATELRSIQPDFSLHLAGAGLPMPKPPSTPAAMYIDEAWADRCAWIPDASLRYSRRQARRGQSFEKDSIRQCKKVFTVGEHVRDKLIDEGLAVPERVLAVGTGRGSIAASPPKDTYGKTVLFVARQRFEEKGGRLMVEAFRDGRLAAEGASLRLVGQDWYRELSDPACGITGVGAVTWERLRDEFEAADLFAMPALREPWGLVYLEALATSTPIVGLNRLAFRQLSDGGRAGYAIPTATVEAVQSTLRGALADEPVLRSKAAHGYRLGIGFSWRKVARRILNEMLC